MGQIIVCLGGWSIQCRMDVRRIAKKIDSLYNWMNGLCTEWRVERTDDGLNIWGTCANVLIEWVIAKLFEDWLNADMVSNWLIVDWKITKSNF